MMTTKSGFKEGVRYVANRVDHSTFPECAETPVEFPTPAALESFLERERNYVLTDHVCPACGTRMVEIEKVGPVPIELRGLVGCLNSACPGADLYYLPGGETLRKLTKREFSDALEVARERGRAFFGLRRQGAPGGGAE